MLMNWGGVPALHVKTAERLQGCLSGEELEAALRILDPPHTEEPNQEVEPIHQDWAEKGPLRERRRVE